VAVSWAEAIERARFTLARLRKTAPVIPDCRPEYYRAFQNLIRAGTRPETHIEIVTADDHAEEKRNHPARRRSGAPLHLPGRATKARIPRAAPVTAAC